MENIEKALRLIIGALGVVTLAFLVSCLLVSAHFRIKKAIEHPALSSGVVTGVSYDDGHTWYSDWTFGRYTFRKANGDGHDHYYVAVTDGRHEDFWEISRETYYNLEIGQKIRRSQIQ